ncbi:MAG: efflux RND transporter periplasmic adaptor subunit, partial [Acidobacteriota bacterium]
IRAKLQSANAGSKDAEQQLRLETNTFDRMKKLFESEAITKQQFEEAQYRYQAALQKLNATEGVVDEVDAAFDETQIKAPIDGEVVSIVSHPGELVSPGYPVITLVDLKDQWVTFNVREDDLKRVTKGRELAVRIPALDKKVTMKVTYISSLGAFAKWKSTGESGRFDLRTFEVRVRPDTPVADLRPGMSAIIFADVL